MSVPDDSAAQAQNQTSATLKAMVDARRDSIEKRVASTLAAFDADLASGAIALDDHSESLEHIAVKWTPPAGWHTAHRATVKALATRTRMSVSWNGCLKCPIRLKPYTPLPFPEAISREKILSAIKATSDVLGGREAAAADLVALSEVIAPILEAFHLGTPRYATRYLEEDGSEDEACAHQQPHAIHRRPCIARVNQY